MCHIEQRAGSVALDPYVSRLGEPRQWTKRARSRNLRLVVFVSG